MSLRTSRTSTRIATTLAVTGLAGLLVAAPASARPDATTGGSDPAPAPAVAVPPAAGVPAITLDDDGVEYAQVGAGLLAGLSLVGAGVALASRRHHRTADQV